MSPLWVLLRIRNSHDARFTTLAYRLGVTQAPFYQ
jgi:hypothetical protein